MQAKGASGLNKGIGVSLQDVLQTKLSYFGGAGAKFTHFQVGENILRDYHGYRQSPGPGEFCVVSYVCFLEANSSSGNREISHLL
jgi:hypothetical protein